MVRRTGIVVGLLYSWVDEVLGMDEVLGIDEVLGVEGSCCWDLGDTVCMVTKGWGVGGMGIGLGSSGFGVEATNGGGSGRACIRIRFSIFFWRLFHLGVQ